MCLYVCVSACASAKVSVISPVESHHGNGSGLSVGRLSTSEGLERYSKGPGGGGGGGGETDLKVRRLYILC